MQKVKFKDSKKFLIFSFFFFNISFKYKNNIKNVYEIHIYFDLLNL